MIPDGTYDAVVDRVEDGVATLEVDGDGDRYALEVDPDALPEPARHADALVRVTVEDERLVEASYDAEETDERAQASQDRFDRLSERPPRVDDRSDAEGQAGQSDDRE